MISFYGQPPFESYTDQHFLSRVLICLIPHNVVCRISADHIQMWAGTQIPI